MGTSIVLTKPGACEIEFVAHQRAGGKNMGSGQDQEPTIEIEDTATTQQETISGGNLGQKSQVVPANQGGVARVPIDDGYNGDVSS